MKYGSIKAWALSTTLIAGMGAAAPAFAQDAEDEAQEDERIVVTGSRIERPNLNSATPINTFNAAQIELSGAVNTAELLRTLPATGVSGLTSTNSNFTTTASGLNTLNLRNLGASRTLVLVNGRRFVAGVPGSTAVDFNSIPTEFVERIDVVTGGASAIYGSDALAGVVNIILRDDFEGVLVSGQAGISDEGDNETYRANITMGSTFADGRGNTTGSYTFSTSNGVYARDREGYDTDGFSCVFFGCPGADWQQDIIPFYSSFSERGRIIVPGNGNWVFDERDGTTRPFQSANGDGSELDGFNRMAYRAIAVPTERHNFSNFTRYEHSPLLNFYMEATYASTQTQSRLEPFPLGSDNIYGGNLAQFVDTDNDGIADASNFGVPILNPLVPEGIRDAARAGADFDNDGVQDIADEDLVVGFARRTTELLNRGAFNRRQTARVVVGMDGDFSDSWSYDVSMNLGRTTQAQQSTGQINVLNMRYALDAIDDGSGNIICRDAIARLQGCVPVNIFGKGAITPAAAGYISAPASTQASIEQINFIGYVTGDLFQVSPFADEDMVVVLGAEYRSEASESVGDVLTQAGLNASNIAPPIVGDFQVAEIFTEVDIPLVQGVQFAEDVRLNVSARASDYTTVGNTFAWAANLQWAVNDMLRFRAQYAEAVRAPNIGELFAPQSQTFPSVTDPCAGLTLSGGSPAFLNNPQDPTSGVNPASVGGNTAQACFADPLVAARVSRDGAFAPSQPELQGVSGFNGGNPNLSEEEATTFTFGFVATPQFGNEWIDRLALTVDYYDIEVTNVITTIGRNTSLGNCYSSTSPTFDPTSQFCSNILRWTSGPFLGALQFVNATQQNLAVLNTSGVDVQASYSLPLNDVTDLFAPSFDVDMGQLTATLAYAYLDTYEREAFAGAGIVDSVGVYGVWEHEWLLGMVYNRGPLTVSYDMTYLPEAGYSSPSDTLRVNRAMIQDMQVRYNLDDINTTLVLGVDNLTDEFIKFGGGLDVTGTFTDGAAYDAIGRRWYVGVRKQF